MLHEMYIKCGFTRQVQRSGDLPRSLIVGHRQPEPSSYFIPWSICGAMEWAVSVPLATGSSFECRQQRSALLEAVRRAGDGLALLPCLGVVTGTVCTHKTLGRVSVGALRQEPRKSSQHPTSLVSSRLVL
jgi:hypothetical protein